MLFHESEICSKISALHVAAYKCHLSIVKLLVNNERNVEYNASGCTALHVTERERHSDVVNFLILKGYDVNAKIGKNKLQKKSSCENKDIWNNATSFIDGISHLSSLYETGSGKTALHLGAVMGLKYTARCLLRNQTYVFIKDNTGTTPLEIIVQKGMSLILVEESMPISFADCNDYNLLHLSAEQDNLLFVQFCIEKHCDINTRSKLLDTSALVLAFSDGHDEVI
ncbi:hypothetical protein AVEN_141839-1 [Araneus ventricosus]|uniref:Uncharacterized protein n=1 Tax=Araneus ventricosus TaxID=182803 RepID=A0A4Y2IJN4_ARAVE|nr:hypothetical protein AVEN_141839-1 [Araneus ventricosus]